ncbi:hypothetical protein J1P25_15275 [Pseudomonas stutzeri]|jgi:Cu-processing system permease protein|uniref:hypothetical protein n=1 Tax=Stutzerimonas stutzeri TaxID=316 RepID=UPI000A60472D|nr:hypothetical protein [Stutzerimonas stutzeri]MBO0643137.1 hypothetical protein [Stutzerimonas stutzeri]
MALLQNCSTGFTLARRANFLPLAAGTATVLVAIVFLAAQFTARQPATTGLDLGISAIRFLLPVLQVLITQELIAREFDRRYILSTFSYPNTRYSFLLGRFLSLTILTLSLLIILAIALALITYIIEQGYSQSTPVALGIPYWITFGFISLDLLVISALATLVAVSASTSNFLLIATFGFLLITRSFGAIINLLTHDPSIIPFGEHYRTSFSILGYLLPDLGALDVRFIALYGHMEFLPPNWPWLVLSNIAYVVGLLSAAVWVLQRKRFS